MLLRCNLPISGFLFFCFFFTIVASSSSSNRTNLKRVFHHQHDVSALVRFKYKADLWNKINTSSHFCQWWGVTCYGNRVVRLVIEDLYLGGQLVPDSVDRLDQLRVLSLQNTSLTGPIPDLSGLGNLKSLFLDHNSFSGSFPLSVLALHRLRTLDFSSNNLTGLIPPGLALSGRLNYLRLDSNRFSGPIPALNQSSLHTFNVSINNLTGAVPVTAVLLRFGISSFLKNPNLCGEIVHKECNPRPKFFSPVTSPPPPPAKKIGQIAQIGGMGLSRPNHGKHSRFVVILAFISGAFILFISIACLIGAVKRRRRDKNEQSKTGKESTAVVTFDAAETAEVAAAIEQESEIEEKVKKLQATKSGSLVFCAGEAHVYTMDQLMTASAELLGRGTVGTTYKALLDSRLIVTVKRLDAIRLAGVGRDKFERHMESVGALGHPNLVPLRAYFQAKEERLLIYDYLPNGSVSSLVHGTKSSRATPLHWTSCLKIAEDVAQGLSYIHQTWQLVHGNLKSSNVLLGPDFEACIADYCLIALATNPPLASSGDGQEDVDAAAYKAPEARHKSLNYQSVKADVYAFGILLLELLTGKQPSKIPVLTLDGMMEWVRKVREEGEKKSGNWREDRDKFGMLTEVAVACSLTSPEQRPTMWQVLKMLQEIKEAAVMEECELVMDSTNSGSS
ncbi:PREDICTED: probable inactive receptor kinase At5g67200 [Camelina sativa]|uniref:Probable inactive receptor kinase At5g67200 n=1 Tax=Camelina sativa TaxID=90675 RepID=A0ABM0UJJ5_CAMSA|nr:PREDICTED: probable inactive receptor kinase At5g67200 [Camelina sativa]